MTVTRNAAVIDFATEYFLSSLVHFSVARAKPRIFFHVRAQFNCQCHTQSGREKARGANGFRISFKNKMLRRKRSTCTRSGSISRFLSHSSQFPCPRYIFLNSPAQAPPRRRKYFTWRTVSRILLPHSYHKSYTNQFLFPCGTIARFMAAKMSDPPGNHQSAFAASRVRFQKRLYPLLESYVNKMHSPFFCCKKSHNNTRFAYRSDFIIFPTLMSNKNSNNKSNNSY